MVSDTSDGCLNSKMRSTTLEEDTSITSSQNMEQESSQNTSQTSHDPVVVSVQQPMTQDTQSQPATQPLDMSDMEQSSQCQEEGVWGQLYPHCGTFPRYH